MNNVVFIVPTGVGCKIGGHAGDATPAAKLIAQTCDKIILHPNVVNASDINEMPQNSLYVEGSILNRFLQGNIELEQVRGNKILIAVPSDVGHETINAINAARITIGAEIEILKMETALIMKGWVDEESFARGSFSGADELISQIKEKSFDVLAIASPIEVSSDTALKYFRTEGGTNPWGLVEAEVSKYIASAINKPVAHAPIESASTKNNTELFNILYNEVVEARKAPEAISNCYIHCILKGLHTAPRIGHGISRNSVACLITPTGIVGIPHRACFDAGIAVIAVEENTTLFNERDSRIIYVKNYLEAGGMVNCIMAGMNKNLFL